jgi:probable O-glycosylation ligase (exosortase A-associated)
MGRIDAWAFAIDVAADRPLVGGGFGLFGEQNIYASYRPGSQIGARAAHSIYFQVLGTQGFVGLVLFMLMLAAGYRATQWMRKRAKGRPDLAMEFRLADMLGLSFVAYGSSGAFLSLATWDLPYTLLAATYLAKLNLARKLDANKSTELETLNETALPSAPIDQAKLPA